MDDLIGYIRQAKVFTDGTIIKKKYPFDNDRARQFLRIYRATATNEQQKSLDYIESAGEIYYPVIKAEMTLDNYHTIESAVNSVISQCNAAAKEVVYVVEHSQDCVLTSDGIPFELEETDNGIRISTPYLYTIL